MDSTPGAVLIADLEIALNTGMRQAEQYGLDWRDVNLQAKRITLLDTKNGSVRHIPLNHVAWSAFQLLGKNRRPEGRAFISSNQPLLTPRYWWDAVVAEAKLADFHWHDLRHSFASRFIMAGVDLRTLQQLMGHKTLQTVVRYTLLSQSHELAAVELLCKPDLGGTGTTTGTGSKQQGDTNELTAN